MSVLNRVTRTQTTICSWESKTTNLDDLKRNGRTVLISCFNVSLEIYIQELENKV
jgi:hypothetical protein